MKQVLDMEKVEQKITNILDNRYPVKFTRLMKNRLKIEVIYNENTCCYIIEDDLTFHIADIYSHLTFDTIFMSTLITDVANNFLHNKHDLDFLNAYCFGKSNEPKKKVTLCDHINKTSSMFYLFDNTPTVETFICYYIVPDIGIDHKEPISFSYILYFDQDVGLFYYVPYYFLGVKSFYNRKHFYDYIITRYATEILNKSVDELRLVDRWLLQMIHF